MKFRWYDAIPIKLRKAAVRCFGAWLSGEGNSTIAWILSGFGLAPFPEILWPRQKISSATNKPFSGFKVRLAFSSTVYTAVCLGWYSLKFLPIATKSSRYTINAVHILSRLEPGPPVAEMTLRRCGVPVGVGCIHAIHPGSRKPSWIDRLNDLRGTANIRIWDRFERRPKIHQACSKCRPFLEGDTYRELLYD